MKHDALRSQIIFGLVVTVAGVIIWRLFVLSYFRHVEYAQTALAQSENISNVLVRGNIYIQDPKADSGSNGEYLVATDKKFSDVAVVPTELNDAAAAAASLSSVLSIDEPTLLASLQSQSSTTKIIARKITDAQVTAINNLNLKGVSIEYETGRYYPGGTLLSNVLGYFGFSDDGQAGQYGVEAYENDALSGDIAPPASGSASPHGFLATLKNYFHSGSLTDDSNPPEPGDVVLTVDRNIQAFVENELATTLAKWHASGGEIIVQDPQTGKILAMVTQPTFDPNNYSASPPSTYLDGNVEQVFEPGSSFKPITMAAGLNLGLVTPDTTYTDTGVLNIDGYQIHDFDNQAHGTVNMTTVLEDSLNLGAAFVENQLGQDNFRNYVVNFGFGQKTGIDLPGEVGGDIANLYSGRQINFVTASFGQGIAVTPLQLITAYSAIANGGKLMKPYIVDHISYENGTTVTTQPEVESIPITPQTSATLRQMLVNVVDLGFDKAQVAGYDVAGKTGTAQIPSPTGGYEVGTFIHDFLGFAPASNPKFVVLVKMDRPQGITYAADSLSPTFRDIAAYLLNYYNIPPDRPLNIK